MCSFTRLRARKRQLTRKLHRQAASAGGVTPGVGSCLRVLNLSANPVVTGELRMLSSTLYPSRAGRLAAKVDLRIRKNNFATQDNAPSQAIISSRPGPCALCCVPHPALPAACLRYAPSLNLKTGHFGATVSLDPFDQTTPGWPHRAELASDPACQISLFLCISEHFETLPLQRNAAPACGARPAPAGTLELSHSRAPLGQPDPKAPHG